MNIEPPGKFAKKDNLENTLMINEEAKVEELKAASSHARQFILQRKAPKGKNIANITIISNITITIMSNITITIMSNITIAIMSNIFINIVQFLKQRKKPEKQSQTCQV